MTTQEIWSIAGAIIASVGGAGVIICAVSGFVSARLANHIDKKYEQRLSKELERYKLSLEERKHITKTQFDKEFEIYYHLSKTFFSMIVKLSSFTEGTLELKDSPKENRDIKIDEFMRMVEVTSAAQNVLYENAPFIPKDIFEQYDAIYEKANNLFWIYEERVQSYAFGKLDFNALVSEADKAVVKGLEKDFASASSKLRDYLNTRAIVE